MANTASCITCELLEGRDAGTRPLWDDIFRTQFAEAAGHPHVHVHIVPRMADLPADRRGPHIFSYLSVPEAERVSEEAMNAIATRIRALPCEQAKTHRITVAARPQCE
ncbi:hypothetical protein HC891_15600 [Candidatus Gracilibacteria bacterium]|nr:hypothetical protein [Candidatus Gracilibacteria bacterium]